MAVYPLASVYVYVLEVDRSLFPWLLKLFSASVESFSPSVSLLMWLWRRRPCSAPRSHCISPRSRLTLQMPADARASGEKCSTTQFTPFLSHSALASWNTNRLSVTTSGAPVVQASSFLQKKVAKVPLHDTADDVLACRLASWHPA